MTATVGQTRIPDTINLGGKEMPLWRFNQLEMLNKEALRTRVLNIRDTVGADQLPPAPRHEEGMRSWILEAQCMITGLSPEEFGTPRMNAQGMPLSRAMSEVSAQDTYQSDAGIGGGSGAPTSANHMAYREARRGSDVARDRNRGTSNLLSWA